MNKILDSMFEFSTKAVILVVELLALSATSFLAKEPLWGIFWIGVLAWLGIMELVSLKITGMTLTNRFRAMMKAPDRQGYAKVLSAMWHIFALTLEYHLIL